MGKSKFRIINFLSAVVISYGLGLTCVWADPCFSALFQLAKVVASNEEFSRIIKGIKEAITQDQSNPEVWSKTGDIFYYLSLHHPQRARVLLRAAISHYQNAYELAATEDAAAPYKKKLIAAEEREGNGLFLEEYFIMVGSEIKVLTGPSGDIEVSIPDFNQTENNSEFAPSNPRDRAQFFISNHMSRVRVVLEMLGHQDDDAMREILHLAPDSESPSTSIVRSLPSVESYLMGAIGGLAQLGDLETSLKDIGQLWELSLLVPDSVGVKDLSVPPFLRPQVERPFTVYSATMLRAFEKILPSLHHAKTWDLMRAYAKDSSKLSWADLLTLTQLCKFLMVGQGSPFEQADLIEMRAVWANQGLTKLKSATRGQISPSVLSKLELLFD